MTARDSIHRHRSGLPYAVALVALAALGACTSSGEAQTPTASSASTSAVTTTAAPPTTTTAPASPTSSVDPVIAKIPAAARPNTEDGGVRFAAFYFEKLNEAFRTGDPSTINALSTPGCVTCKAFSDGVQKLKSQGRHYGSDLVSVKSASALNFTNENRQVLLQIKQSTVDVLNSSGAKVDTTPGGEASFVSSLNFTEGRWTVTRLQKAKS